MSSKDTPEWLAYCLMEWAESWEAKAQGKETQEDDDTGEETVTFKEVDAEEFLDESRREIPELKSLIAELRAMLKAKAA